MLLARSLVFHAGFYIITALNMLFILPGFLLLSTRDGYKLPRCWSKHILWWQHLTIGNTYEFRGVENVPKEGAYVVASKHQSSWETYALLSYLDMPTIILKREVTYLPLFGWMAGWLGTVPVDRGDRRRALDKMTKVAAHYHSQGERQIVIFPEGTRTKVGSKPNYKYGVQHMYKSFSPHVLPVALNSGLFWPRSSLILYPGHIIVEFLPVIEPGMEPEKFSVFLQETIEDRSNALISEALADPAYGGPLPPVQVPDTQVSIK